MPRILAVAAATLLAASTAFAQPKPLEAGSFEVKNLGDLVEICRTGQTDPHFLEAVGYCNGYGRGALDYHRAIVPASAPPLFCAPPRPQAEGLRSRFVAWADAPPARLARPAVEGVFAFLAATYPCPARRR